MRAFAAVVATGSFTAAAERLGSTPQLVSKYVAALEHDLGTRLLNRTTRRVALTEAGRALHPRCMGLLEDFDALRADARQERMVPRGHLNVAAPITFGELRLAGLLQAFAERWPEVTVELKLSDRFVDLVAEGVELAIRIGNLEDSSLIARRLADMPILCVASPNYLAQAGEPRNPAELKHHRCVIDTNFREPEKWPFLVDGERVTMTVTGQIRANSASAVRTLVLANAGIALCPAYAVDNDIEEGRLVALFGAASAQSLAVHAVYPPTRHLSARVRVFVEMLAEHMTKDASNFSSARHADLASRGGATKRRDG
ncbi:MAG: LysR family transcriptional regulator [Hyphomicrobiaceae bacterium]